MQSCTYTDSHRPREQTQANLPYTHFGFDRWCHHKLTVENFLRVWGDCFLPHRLTLLTSSLPRVLHTLSFCRSWGCVVLEQKDLKHASVFYQLPKRSHQLFVLHQVYGILGFPFLLSLSLSWPSSVFFLYKRHKDSHKIVCLPWSQNKRAKFPRKTDSSPRLACSNMTCTKWHL